MRPRARSRTSTGRGTAPRRTRAEHDAARSAETRTRLLEAAFDCLHERGLARTTTVEIGRRAGAARGTLLHHFPSRESLIVAALEHVFDRRLDEVTRGMARTPRGPDGQLLVDASIDLLWRAIRRGRSTVVWVELLVAARTDRVLQRELTRMMRAFDDRINAAFRTAFPAGELDQVDLDLARRFAFALLNGLVLDHIAGFDKHLKPAVAALKRVLPAIALMGK